MLEARNEGRRSIILAHLEHGKEGLLGDLHLSHLLHAPLSRLLFLE
jgi:hypothetical protein